MTRQHFDMTVYGKFEQALKIDKHGLDDELLQQSDIFYRVSKEVAFAASRRDMAYDNIKVTDAGLNATVREELTEEGEKVTEGKVQASVLAHPDHIAAVKEHLAVKEEAELLDALKNSFSMRSYMLRELCSLHNAGYFADKPMQSKQVKDARGTAARGSLDDGRKSRKNTRTRKQLKEE